MRNVRHIGHQSKAQVLCAVCCVAALCRRHGACASRLQASPIALLFSASLGAQPRWQPKGDLAAAPSEAQARRERVCARVRESMGQSRRVMQTHGSHTPHTPVSRTPRRLQVSARPWGSVERALWSPPLPPPPPFLPFSSPPRVNLAGLAVRVGSLLGCAGWLPAY